MLDISIIAVMASWTLVICYHPSAVLLSLRLVYFHSCNNYWVLQYSEICNM